MSTTEKLNNKICAYIDSTEVMIREVSSSHKEVSKITYKSNKNIDLLTKEFTDINLIIKANKKKIEVLKKQIFKLKKVIPQLYTKSYFLSGKDDYFYPVWFSSENTSVKKLTISSNELFCELELIGGSEPDVYPRSMEITSLIQKEDNIILGLPSVNLYCSLLTDRNNFGYNCRHYHGVYLRGNREYTLSTYSKKIIDSLGTAFKRGTGISFVNPNYDMSVLKDHRIRFDNTTYITKVIHESKMERILQDIRNSNFKDIS